MPQTNQKQTSRPKGQSQQSNKPRGRIFNRRLKTWQWVSVLAVVMVAVAGVLIWQSPWQPGGPPQPSQPQEIKSIRYKGKKYYRTDQKVDRTPIPEKYKIAELKGGEIVYLVSKDSYKEFLSLKPENIGEEGKSNRYIYWIEEEQYQYNQRIEEIEVQIKKLNYCTKSEDCTTVGFGCPFGCWSLVNKSRKKEIRNIKEDIKEVKEKYGRMCMYKCALPPDRLECVNRKCRIEKVEKEPVTISIDKIEYEQGEEVRVTVE